MNKMAKTNSLNKTDKLVNKKLSIVLHSEVCTYIICFYCLESHLVSYAVSGIESRSTQCKASILWIILSLCSYMCMYKKCFNVSLVWIISCASLIPTHSPEFGDTACRVILHISKKAYLWDAVIIGSETLSFGCFILIQRQKLRSSKISGESFY